MNQIELLYEVPVSCANSISEKICIQPKAFSIQHSCCQLIRLWGSLVTEISLVNGGIIVFFCIQIDVQGKEKLRLISDICGKIYPGILKQR